MKNSKLKDSFSTRKFKLGAYATVISVIAIVIVFLVNLFVQELNVSIDLTSDGKYSLTEETVELVKGVEDELTIYYLFQSGSEIEEFKRIVDNYNNLNSKVKVKYKDPVQYPKFASNYVDEDISDQSFLIVNETNGSAKYLTQSEVIEYEMDYSTYEYNVTGISLEQKIDAAIQAVTNENLPTVYSVSGHGEGGISTYMGTLLTEGNITHSELSTLTSEEIPEDCDILFINQPQYDLTQDETTMILDYLKSGGDAIICVDYVSSTLPNFTSIVQYYGVDIIEGYVIENDSKYFRGHYPTELVPAIASHAFTNDFKGKKYVISPVSTGLTIREDIRDTVSTSTLLKTSDSAFSKVDFNSTVATKEENDIAGPFILGMEIVEDETNIAIYSGKYLWQDSYLSTTAFANVDLLYNTINGMTGQENVISVRSMSLDENYLVLTQAQKNRIGLIVIGLIPLAFLIPGICIVVRRRKK